MSQNPPPLSSSGFQAWLGTLWGKIVTASAVLATAIGAVGIAVTVTESLGRNDTTVESLSVESEMERTGAAAVDGVGMSRYEGDSADWAVPVGAPFDEFFADSGEERGPTGCTPSQLAWLKGNGVPYTDNYLRVDLVNTATSGSRLMISEIRAEGELTEPDSGILLVSCRAGQGGEPLAQYARLALGTGENAVFGDILEGCEAPDGYCWYAGTGQVGEAGMPVVFDIAPGEAATLVLRYDHAANFSGRFVATVSVDGVESTLVLTPNGEDIYAPVVTIRSLKFVSDNGVAGCELAGSDNGRAESCTDNWRDLLAAATQ